MYVPLSVHSSTSKTGKNEKSRYPISFLLFGFIILWPKIWMLLQVIREVNVSLE